MENTAVIRKTGSALKPPAGRRRGTAKPAAERPCGNDGNGFLKHRFRSLWAVSGNRGQIEREFYNSLSNLCRFYRIPPPQTGEVLYPQNIYAAWQRLEPALKAVDPNLNVMILKDRGRQAVLATAKMFGIGYSLYFIPIRTWWRWSQCAEKQEVTELILTIFAYLYHIVDIPCYTENDSFMNSQYDTLYQWLMDDYNEAESKEDEEWREHQENTLYEASKGGMALLRLLKDPYWLQQMETKVTSFRHRDEGEQEWELLGRDFLRLYRDYPRRSLADSTRPDLICPAEEERIRPDMYTGFFWSCHDCFADELDEMLTCYFQEIPVMDEPLCLRFFDTLPVDTAPEFDFEHRLFDLIDRLRDLLNQYDTKE